MHRSVAAAGCVLVLAACASSTVSPAASPTSGNSDGDTPAAGLRVQLDLLFGEHVFAVAKLADAAAAGRSGEYQSYAGLLARNGGDLTAALHTALGETGGAQFGAAWTQQNNLIVDYVVAAATHDQAKADAATSQLSTSYVPQMASVIASSLAMSSDAASKLATAHIAALKTLIDDAAGAAYPQLYQDILAAHAEAVSFGDTVAVQVAHVFPDRYPGDVHAAAADSRARRNVAMQRQAYLMTMASDASVTAVPGELAAANAALTANGAGIAGSSAVWADEANLVGAYAKSGDPSARQDALNRAAGPPDVTTPIAAVLQVVDDQRAQAYDRLAGDDRAAAAAFAVAAEQQPAAASG